MLDEARVDVNQIRTQQDLEEAFKKIEQIGKKAVVISSEEWSLGNHFITTAYSLQSPNEEESRKYFEGLKKGTIDLEKDQTLNGLLDTFDMLKAYNMYKDNPLLPSYDKCIEVLGKGEVGFWYMGNWVINSLVAYDNTAEFGFITVPISNDTTTYGNSEIMAAIKYAIIDGTNSSKEQQDAAKRFLDWLVYEESGQNFLVKEASLIPAFNNNEVMLTDSLGQSIKSYQDEGHVIELMSWELYDDNAETIGRSLKNYLSNQIDRETLLKEIRVHWQRE